MVAGYENITHVALGGNGYGPDIGDAWGEERGDRGVLHPILVRVTTVKGIRTRLQDIAENQSQNHAGETAQDHGDDLSGTNGGSLVAPFGDTTGIPLLLPRLKAFQKGLLMQKIY